MTRMNKMLEQLKTVREEEIAGGEGASPAVSNSAVNTSHTSSSGLSDGAWRDDLLRQVETQITKMNAWKGVMDAQFVAKEEHWEGKLRNMAADVKGLTDKVTDPERSVLLVSKVKNLSEKVEQLDVD